MIAYWVPEQGQIPAKIIVVEIPSRKEVSTKNRHLVSEVHVNREKKIGENSYNHVRWVLFSAV